MKPFKYNPNKHTGMFRNRIEIVYTVIAEDELSNQIERDEKFIDAWAMIKTLKGSEYLKAAAVQATKIYRFVIHYTPGITNDMKVSFDGRTFDIIEPPTNDDEMDKTLTIIAKERVKNG
ncbi:phage head closure protein [Lederbergia lenta]|uniref:phage head closure protein n=1 Tax=Lederbergia lenta TaxID=1467 RepID=UPI0020400606|nr:phage head closure protein [Lederbergia lenta]MCM3111679.1 phage head closure protein [Lederbergia lenta]